MVQTTSASSASPLPGHDSTIYILSQLPLTVVDGIIQAVTGGTTAFESGGDAHPWTIKNRYYEADVTFRISDSPEHLLDCLRAQDWAAAAVILVADKSKPIDLDLLDKFDTDSIDVPLVVGISPSGATSTSFDEEELSHLCLLKGYEYIAIDGSRGSLAAAGNKKSQEEEEEDDDDGDANAGPSGTARLSEALQAHMWPNSRMVSRSSVSSRLPFGAAPETSQPDVMPSQSSTGSPETANTSRRTAVGFEDDFAPFVSGDPGPLQKLEGSSVRDAGEGMGADWEDESDPTAGFSAIFAQLAGLRDQAAGIKDENARKDFAAEIALSFARQLDAMALEDSEGDPNQHGKSHGGSQDGPTAK